MFKKYVGISLLALSPSLFAAKGIDALNDNDFKTLYAHPDNATCIWYYGKEGYQAKTNGTLPELINAMKKFCDEAQVTLKVNGQTLGLTDAVIQTTSLKYVQPRWQDRYKALFPEWRTQIDKRLDEAE